MFSFFHLLAAAGKGINESNWECESKENKLTPKVQESRKKTSKSDKSNVTWLFVHA